MPSHHTSTASARAIIDACKAAAIPAAALAAFTAAAFGAQPSSNSPLAPPANGPRANPPQRHVLTNIDVHVRPGTVLEDVNLYIVGDRIDRVEDGEPRAGFRVHDATGLHAFAGFIDPWVEVATPTPNTSLPGSHWSPLVTPQRSVLDGDGIDADTREKHRAMGFTAAAAVPQGGVFQGRAAVISLAMPFDDSSDGQTPVYAADAFHAMSFQRGGWPSANYPTSQMGASALIRQTIADANWLATLPQNDPERVHNSLEFLNNAAMPMVIDTRDELESLLAYEIIAEHRSNTPVIVGSGTEFKRLDAFAARKAPMIIPLSFAKSPDVSSPGHADAVDLEAMMLWEQTPTNPRRLDDAGIPVAITTAKLGRGQKFTDALTATINAGLAPDRALAMLTTTPAAILGVDSMMGTIERGKLANIIVADGHVFDTDTTILDVWVDGRPHTINEPKHEGALDGEWRFLVGPVDAPAYEMTFTIDGTKVTTRDGDDEGKAHRVDIRHGTDGTHLSFIIHSTDNDTEGTGIYLVSGTLDPDGHIRGTALDPAQNPFTWTGIRSDSDEQAEAAAPKDADKLSGEWHLTLSGQFHLGMTIAKPSVKPSAKPSDDTDNETSDQPSGDAQEVTIFEDTPTGRATSIANVSTLTDDTIELTFDHAPFGASGTFGLTGTRTADAIHGTGTLPNGRTFPWFATRTNNSAPNLPGYPFGPYALTSLPQQESVAIINATVWTQGNAGTIPNGYVMIDGGTIRAVGPMPALGELTIPAGARVIDAKGKHVAPGIIDAHSHTGLFSAGVNESGQAVTSEVRIGDSTNPDAVSWYRQLASGVTSVLQLHGSANPIGGQSQTLKIRWGITNPFDMHFEDAIPGIKFALGENVKQSNWGDDRTTRYPQTRMGVETLMRDRFHAARAYLDNGMKTPNGRVDLELEALAQILAGERLIHCHSYRQDEILMLCRIAEDFGFTIGTFTHGLEVYKVAESVQQHAIGASLFADWWAYKVEVQDAIPFAGPLQSEVGVLTSYNSDSDELVRRLNTEAGKAFHYAKRMGLDFSEADALAFVTINPAKQLKIDNRTGSIEAGKDADLAIWSGNPLSTLARCETTFVDGRELFSLERDAGHRQRIADERQRLIAKILDLPEPADKTTDSESNGSDNADDTDLVDPGFANATSGRGRMGVINPALMDLSDTEIEQLLMQPGMCGCHWQWAAP